MVAKMAGISYFGGAAAAAAAPAATSAIFSFTPLPCEYGEGQRWERTIFSDDRFSSTSVAIPTLAALKIMQNKDNGVNVYFVYRR